MPPGEPDADIDTTALIDTVIARYHRVHSRELPDLVLLAHRVEEAHRDHPSVPEGLSALLKQMLGELTIHMQKEELLLFPRMRKGGWAQIDQTIAALMADHETHQAHIRAISGKTDELRAPADACGTWRALYAGLAKFVADLSDHIRLENEVLFPRFMHG